MITKLLITFQTPAAIPAAIRVNLRDARNAGNFDYVNAVLERYKRRGIVRIESPHPVKNTVVEIEVEIDPHRQGAELEIRRLIATELKHHKNAEFFYVTAEFRHEGSVFFKTIAPRSKMPVV